MSMSSGFFESNVDESGIYDRVYYAHEFAHYFSQFISNGVFGNPTNQLKVSALKNKSISVLVNIGNAFIDGFWFYSNEIETIKLSNASGTLPRYDAIVVGYDAVAREITMYVKEGKYAAVPVKPTISKTPDHYELCLAYVYVGAEAVELEDADIEDTRPNEDLCGFVVSMVQHLETKDLFNQYQSAFNVWFDNLKAEGSSDLEGFNQKFLLWFDTIKGHLTEDAATSLNLRLDDLEMEVNGYVSRVTTFLEDGSIMEVYSNGRVKSTVFNEDGSVTERTLDRGIMIWEKQTTFQENGVTEESVRKGDFV